VERAIRRRSDLMKKSKKKYKRPRILWNTARIEREKILKRNYGLVRAREIWSAETLLRKYRRLARRLVGVRDKDAEKVLLKKVTDVGFLEKDAGLDEVLGLTVENILDRRLQTVVFKKGLANTPMQARQIIVHGHVKVNGRKSTSPSRLVLKEDESKIEVSTKMKKGK